MSYWLTDLLWSLPPLGLGGWFLWRESQPWRRQRHLRRHGRAALATVLRIEPNFDGERGDFLHLGFTAAADGAAEALVEASTYAAPGTRAVGDQLAMRYDPRNPWRCLTTGELCDPGHRRGLLFMVGFGLYILMMGFPTWFGSQPGRGELLTGVYFFIFFGLSFLL